MDEVEKKLEKLKKAKNVTGQPHFDTSRFEESKINLVPDASISLGKFKPSKLMDKTYLAHPTTIKAMKKDIFAAGNELFEDLEDIVECLSCRQQIDRQFWHFCPFCEAQFPKN